MYNHPLYPEQVALEQEAADATKQQHWKDIHGARADQNEADTTYGVRLLRGMLTQVEDNLRSHLTSIAEGKAGRHRRGYQYVKDADPEVCAYLALKCALGSISAETKLLPLALDIGTRLCDQLLLDKFKREHPDLFRLTEWKIKSQAMQQRDRRKTLMRLFANRAGVQFDMWSKDERIDVGCMLLDAVLQTGLLVMHEYTTKARGKMVTEKRVVAGEAVIDSIDQIAAATEMLKPRLLPTIIPPKPWSTPWNGGYWSGLFRESIVKTNNPNLLEEIAASEPREVYDALNRVQETPWRVNARVYEVMLSAAEYPRSIGGLPTYQCDDIPPKPGDIDSNEEAKNAWKKAAAGVYNANRRTLSKRFQLASTLAIAGQFGKYESIYFPHTLDFRGRLYALPMFLNPQGPDYTKALLTFAHGKPIETGVDSGWLAIHGANTFGFDKVGLEERIGWVEQHEGAILQAAADPLGTTSFWEEAADPWQFLAFCFEWSDFLKHGYGFVSSLPVALDGTCNGIQHYSAMLRDSVGAEAVNMTPNLTPNDIYLKVAEETLRLLNQDYTDVSMKEAWLQFGIDRKITKRSVMTLPYGCTRFSCRSFVEDAVRDKIETGVDNPFANDQDDGIFAASRFLQDILWEAIGNVVIKAREAMDWLRATAQAVSKHQLPISWVTPDGFVVMQRYPNMQARRVKTFLDGSVVRLTVRDEGNKIDARRMANGVAPNFVHSMDATALRMYVNLAAFNGIKHFAVVHDSFATVAADVNMMQACIKEAFVDLYTEHDPLQSFYEQVVPVLTDAQRDKLPPIPERGQFDLQEVLQSEYFFC